MAPLDTESSLVVLGKRIEIVRKSLCHQFDWRADLYWHSTCVFALRVHTVQTRRLGYVYVYVYALQNINVHLYIGGCVLNYGRAKWPQQYGCVL